VFENSDSLISDSAESPDMCPLEIHGYDLLSGFQESQDIDSLDF
jgi:hypothetical protein